METIKQQLLSSLENITRKFDYNNEETQHIEICSVAYDKEGNVYELLVEVKAFTKPIRHEADYYYNDYGGVITQSENYTYEIRNIAVDHVYNFKNGSDSDIVINETEVLNAIEY